MERKFTSANGQHPSLGAAFFYHLSLLLVEVSAEDVPDMDYAESEFEEMLECWQSLGDDAPKSKGNHITLEFGDVQMVIRFDVEINDIKE